MTKENQKEISAVQSSDKPLFSDDSPLFASESNTSETPKESQHEYPWTILIVDDEEEIHTVTKLVLKNYRFAGQPLRFLDAYSSKEAKEILQKEPNIALALLDVVMEEDDAGLSLVKYIREDLDNQLTRLVLRTGQPGQAPEETVISTYDINDYKDKTELTATKLKTLMYSTLRSYRDITALSTSRSGLQMVIEASAKIFEIHSLQKFATAVLMQITSLLGLEENAAYFQVMSGFAATEEDGDYYVLAGTGSYKELINKQARALLPSEVCKDLDQALSSQHNLYFNNHLVAYFRTETGVEHLLYVTNFGTLDELDKELLEVFCSNVSVAFENAHLKEEIEATQDELLYLLGEAIETRSEESGFHVERIAEISKLLALELGLDEDKANLIRSASPLHDIGKIGVPETVLKKQGKHSPEEEEIMKRHVTIGYEMLRKSKRPVMKYGAIMAHEHHEHWDGTGYPRGLKGEEIHLVSRITAVADVFDALYNERPYKEPWPINKVVEYFKEEKGKRFDPKIVDILLSKLDQFLQIENSHPDKHSPTAINT